jgi:hypothetical protein
MADNYQLNYTGPEINEALAKIRNIAVPEKTSDLENDSDFVVASDLAAKADLSTLTSHTEDTQNPHKLTPASLGLIPETWTFINEEGKEISKVIYTLPTPEETPEETPAE